MYYLIYSILYLISLLPFWALYILSDILYIVLFKIVRYRYKVVHTNIYNSFPNKTEAEKEKIIKGFYHHLSDTIVETVKLMSISDKGLRKRFRFTSMDLFEHLYEKYDGVIGLMSHMGNWEWYSFGTVLTTNHALSAIYLPLSNKAFDKIMFDMRERKGAKLINMNLIVRHILETKGQKRIYAFIADQTPQNKPGIPWLTFLNQDTPVYDGAEQLARRCQLPVIFGTIHRVRHGYFEATIQLISTPPHNINITAEFYKLLEADINAYPSQWLWSHRRWKHKRLIESGTPNS